MNKFVKFNGSHDIFISNSRLMNNMAGYSGSLYQGFDLGIFMPTRIQLVNVSFMCCADGNYVKNGSLIFTSYGTHIINVTFYDVSEKSKSVWPAAGLILDSSGSEHSVQGAKYTCPNKKILFEMTSVAHQSNNNTAGDNSKLLGFLIVVCLPCTYPPYAVRNATFQISSSNNMTSDTCIRENYENIKCNKYGHSVNTTSPCKLCPFGADCSKGKIRSHPNFWGYTYNGSDMFQTCPLRYCCNDIDIPCESYDTFTLHRQGRLRGECEPGYTESLMSRTCVPDEKCHDWWVWPIAIILAFSYPFWYMYKGTVQPGFEYILSTLISFKFTKQNIIHVKSAEVSKPDLHEDMDCNGDKAYFDILVYFVNIITLLKVKVEFQSSETGDGFLYSVEKYFTRYLDLDVQQVANVTVCPFSGINAITKYLAGPGFIGSILLDWTILYFMATILSDLFKKRKQRSIADKCQNFKLKLIEGYVETMKYSYSGLAGVTFIFLTCVHIGNSQFWKYNAEVKCFSDWQFGVIILAALYTIPFSIATMVGLYLHGCMSLPSSISSFLAYSGVY